MRAVEVIVMKVVGKEGSAVITGVIGAGVGPLAGDGLDEAFGFAIGLRSIGPGKEMLEAEFLAGSGEGFGAIGGAAIGQELLDVDAMSGVKADGLLQSAEDTLSSFVGEQASESEAGVVVDGDVQAFEAGAGIALSAVPGGANPGAGEAAELLDVEVEEGAGMVAFVAPRWRFGRFQRREAIEVMTAQDARKSSLGDGQNHHNLGVGAALAAQSQDLGFELGADLARLGERPRGTIGQALGEPSLASPGEPAPDRLLADAESEGGGAQREVELGVLQSHLGSSERSQSGISVHVFRAGRRWVEC